MSQDTLTSLPLHLQVRIASHLSAPEQLPLLQTCKALRDATVDARRTRLVQLAQRPGRFCGTDPFPTMMEYVQLGGQAHPRKMHLPNILRLCEGPAPKGMLREAAGRRAAALACIDASKTRRRGAKLYFGEIDARKRPHGVGRCVGFGDCLESSYFGEWRHGKRCGVGIQFYWDYPGHTHPHGGGWYEGEWDKDMFHGMGMLVSDNLVYQEGRWEYNNSVGEHLVNRTWAVPYVEANSPR